MTVDEFAQTFKTFEDVSRTLSMSAIYENSTWKILALNFDHKMFMLFRDGETRQVDCEEVEILNTTLN